MEHFSCDIWAFAAEFPIAAPVANLPHYISQAARDHQRLLEIRQTSERFGATVRNVAEETTESGPPTEAASAARFVELLTAHQRKLYAYISTLLMGDVSAADVLQDTNIDLWARSKDFDFNRPFLPWAFAFARQRVLAFRKSQSRSRLVFSDAAMARIDEECTRLAGDADLRLSALRGCIKKLNPQQAYLIGERYHARTSVKLIGAQLGETAHNVASQLHRIRRSLGKCIDATLAAEER